VRTDSDYGIDSLTSDIPRELGQGVQGATFEQHITIFGTVAGKLFLTNPTSCSPATTRIEASSYEAPGTFAAAQHTFTPTGCADSGKRPPLDKTNVTLDPASKQAGAPSGYTVKVSVPAQEKTVSGPNGLHTVSQSHVRSTRITLPDGIALSPGAANELEGCMAAQFGMVASDPPAFNSGPVSCPAASKVGDVTVRTPLLAQPLTGAAYFSQPTGPGLPTDANPWKLFILAQGSGDRVKLVGEVTIDPVSGQITSSFENLPQQPFTEFEINLRGGDRAILENPRSCGTHSGSSELGGHSGAVATPSVQLDMSSFTGCARPLPFQPTFDAS
jgi:hypothetical protein